MAFVKNQAVTGFVFDLQTTLGAAITSGTVTGYYLLDGGTQTAIAGTPVHEGNGQWSVNLTASEMNGDLVGLLFVHTDGRASFTIKTVEEEYGTLAAGTPSEVELCNLALLDLGADVIESLSEDSDRARLCRHVYPDVRDEILADLQPHCAVRRSLLAATTAPTFEANDGLSYAFALPTGCIKPLSTDDEYSAWQIEGNTLLADRTPVYLRYVYRLEDTTKYPQHVKTALVAYLSARMAYAITKSNSLMEQKYKFYQIARDKALSLEGQEGTPAIVHTPTLTTDVRS